MNKLNWIRYGNRIISLGHITHVYFTPAVEAGRTGRGDPVAATLRVFFMDEGHLQMSGQGAEDLWAIFQTQSLNLTRRDDDKADGCDSDNRTDLRAMPLTD